MIVKQIIPADHHTSRKEFQKEGSEFLNVSEFYCDTIQGEGVYSGHPSAFLRLKGCHINCSYCDSTEVWRYGTPFSFGELFELMDAFGLPDKLKKGHHLVITGGAPLLQQDRLLNFFMSFVNRYKFQPVVEIENEATIMPHYILDKYIYCWNNSPKLNSSNVDFERRYKPEVLKRLSEFENSWFKFVISEEKDWEEIENGFLLFNLIKKSQIILMPEGATRKEIEFNRQMVVDLAIENNVRFTDRLHISIWDRKVGI